MSTYKVIQDIEAEDKLVGPLSFRQFVYALVAAFCFYISFICLTHNAAFLILLFLPPGLVSGFFAFPFGKDQPTEVWALAKIRFLFKPRQRIWDQSGVKELVTITVPKKVEHIRTNGLSQNEVSSRLSALANTIDSRGWAVKNVNLNLSASTADNVVVPNSDRLVDMNGLPQEVPTTDIVAADDILDEQSNPIAHQFDQMIAASTQAHRQQIMAMMQQPSTPTPAPAASQPAAKPADYWFLNNPVQSGQNPPTLVQPQAQVSDGAQTGVVQAAEPTADEEAFALQLNAQHAKPTAAYGHLKTIQPLSTAPAGQPNPAPVKSTAKAQPPTPPKPVTPGPSPAILELAGNNDLNVATLARQAHKTSGDLSADDGEVVIALR